MIERTLQKHIALGYADAVSQHVSHDTARSPLRESVDGVGSLSAPQYSYTAFADCAFDPNGEQTSTRHSFRSLARSYVGDYVERFC
ncbi:hypothetical protein RCH14_000969 [Massilia sp. MP_M2]